MVGTPLRYTFQQGRRSERMVGRITAREPDRRLAMRFTDRAMQVDVDFRLTPGAMPGSSTLTHTTAVRPQGVARLLGPLIRLGLPRQTRDANARIKAIAEGAASLRPPRPETRRASPAQGRRNCAARAPAREQPWPESICLK